MAAGPDRYLITLIVQLTGAGALRVVPQVVEAFSEMLCSDAYANQPPCAKGDVATRL